MVILALPSLVSNGPIISTDARVQRMMFDPLGKVAVGVENIMPEFSRFTMHPHWETNSHIACTSDKCGMDGTCSVSAVSKEAAMIGSTAFFAG